MMKKFLFLFLLFVPNCVAAQQITITGQVKDPNGIPYTNGRGRVILVPTNVFFTTGLTNPVPGSQSPVVIDGLDANGRFTVVLTSTGAIDQQTSNPQWLFTFCSAPILQFGPICFSGPTLALTSSQDITAQISAVPPPVLPGGGGGGGAFPAPPSNVLQKAANPPNSFSASGLTDDGTNLTVDRDTHFKGPNPWLDVTRFGVRTCVTNTSPCNAGITAATSSGQAGVTISAASSFINGDGVVVYGAGAPHSMPTPGAPTVTPSVARVLTGTRDVIPGPTGATTYNYQIFAEDKNGGLTAVGSVGTTTTGAASLGSQSATLTSCSRANDVVTCTTSTPHGLFVGSVAQMVYLTSTADPLFSGFYSTSAVGDTTHFSFTSGMDTRNGAATSTTGGTVFWFNCNHLTWSSVAGAYRYWIAGRTGGSLTTIGYSWPTNPTGNSSPITVGVTSWDDFGSTMMGNLTLPRWIPTTPPATATSDHLSTTILAGAGTTSLTLANSAGTTLPSATIALDAVPGIKAAIASAQTSPGGVPPIFFPIDTTGKSYVINSFLDLTSSVAPTLQVPGGLYLNNTIELPNASKLVGGSTITDTTQTNSFQFEGLPIVTVSTAYPGIHIANGAQCRVEGLTFVGNTSGGFGGNNYTLIVQDGGGGNPGTTYNRISLSTGSANDYMGIGILCRGVSGTFSCPMLMDQVHSLTGPSVVQGASATPAILCTNCPGNVQFHTMMLAHRGIFVGQDLSGGTGFKMDWAYEQGAMTPLVTMAPAVEGGAGGGTVVFAGPIVEDTVQTPLFTLLAGNGTSPLTVVDHSSAGAGFTPSYSGLRTAVFGRGGFPIPGNTGESRDVSGFINGPTIDGIFSPNSTDNMGVLYTDGYVGVGPGYGFFIDASIMAPPGVAVSAGGSVPIGNISYQVTPVWQNGGISIPSAKAVATTTTGNQTVTVTWTPVPGNCKGYSIWRGINGSSGAQLSSTTPLVTGCSSTTYVDTLAVAAGASFPRVPAGGPTMMLPGVQGIVTPALTVGTLPVFGVAYTTASATTGASIGTTTMATAGAGGNKYVFNITAAQVAGGTSCTGNSTLAVFVQYTDAVTNVAQVPTLGGYSIANSTFAGNAAPVLAVTNGAANTMAINWNPMVINAKANTTVSYGTTYTPGTGCSPAPTYYVTPSLVQIQ